MAFADQTYVRALNSVLLASGLQAKLEELQREIWGSRLTEEACRVVIALLCAVRAVVRYLARH